MPLSPALRLCFLGVAAAASVGGFAAGWFVHKPGAGSAPNGSSAAASPLVTDAAPRPGAAPGSPAAVPSPPPKGGIPSPAAALLKTLDPSGGLKSQATILAYASSLDVEAARKLARSFEGRGYTSDRNVIALRQAVFTRWAELDAEGVLQAVRVSPDHYVRRMGMSAGLNAMALKNPEAAWARAGEMGPLKTEAQRSVIDSLAAMDPEAALKMCAKMDGLAAQWTMGGVLTAWADRDPAAAGKAAAEMPAGRARTSAIEGLMGRWAVSDYSAAAAWAAALSTPQERAAAMRSALDALSRVDPAKALSQLDATDVGNGRADILRNIMGTMALKDFDAALARLSSFTSFVDKRSALEALTGAAGDEEDAKLLKLAQSLPANLSRSIYQNSLWRSMYRDPSELTERIGKIPLPSLREQTLREAAENMSGYMPDQAAAYFSKLQSTSQTPDTAGQIAGGMAQTDPEKAVAWANGLGNEALKKSALSTAIREWANADPARAGQELAKIANADTRAEVARSVVGNLAGRSLKEAESWAESLTGADRNAALAAVVESAAWQSPDRVEALYTRFTAGLSPEEAGRSENAAIAKNIANQMAQTDARRAASWSLGLPEGGARDEAVSGVVSTWAAYDAVGASEWLQNLPEGKGRDLAAANLVTAIAKDDPDGAWAWATNIADPVSRREAAGAALAGWKANGQRAEAQAALDAGGFSASEFEELKRVLE